MAVPNRASATRHRSEMNRDTRGREQGKLGDRLTRRRTFRVVKDVDEHVLRIVRVDDAEEWRDRGSAYLVLSCHIQIEALCCRETRSVPRTPDELRLASAASRTICVEAGIVYPSHD